MKEIFAPGGTAEQSLKKIRDEYKKRRPIPDYTIIVPEHLELDALLINTDEYDLGGQGNKHVLTSSYVIDVDGYRGLTLPERGELGINLIRRHVYISYPLLPGKNTRQHRHKSQDIIEIAKLVISKGGEFTVQRFAGKYLLDPEERKLQTDMLRAYARRDFFDKCFKKMMPYLADLMAENEGYRNVTPDAAPQATPAAVRQDFAGSTIIMYNFFGNSEPYITNISGDKNQVNLAANNAVLHTVQNNGTNMQELERILSNLTQRIPPNIGDTEKEKITDSIDVIRTEAQKAQPKKNVLKTALSVLQAIKGSAEFAANVATFCAFIHNLL